MKILFVSRDIPKGMYDILKDKYNIRLMRPCERLDLPVCTHADMILGVVDGGAIVTREYYEKNADLFSGVDPVITEEAQGGEYPRDILLNFIDVKTAVIGLEKHITRYAKTKPVINVKQGYARCSTLLGEGYAVSSDAGILSALSSLNYDTLLICPGDIVLNGCGYGFIGGASFVDGGDVYFFGSLSYHKDGERIRQFLKVHKAKIHELADTPLTDLGGAVVL